MQTITPQKAREMFAEIGYKVKAKRVGFSDLARGQGYALEVSDADGEKITGGRLFSSGDEVKAWREKHAAALEILENVKVRD